VKRDADHAGVMTVELLHLPARRDVPEFCLSVETAGE
jgi:hypothetical protein